MTHRLLLLCCTLVASPAVAQTTSTQEQFAELGNLMTGHWTSEMTLVTDSPVLGKKQGEKAHLDVTIKWTANKHALEVDRVVAETRAKSIFFWDAETKMIKRVHVSSSGSTSTATLWKANDKWNWKIVETHPDGTKLTGSGTSFFEDGGKTRIIDGTVSIDGKEQPHFREVQKRVDKS